MESNQDKTIAANQASHKEAALSPGTMIGDKYRIDSLIGIGGMGAVYRVHQIFLGKDFALKALDLHQTTDASVRRFHQEARTASQLQHPNLVEVHDFGMFGDKQPYLVMDIVEGVTLSDVIKQKGTLPVDYVAKLCIQLSFGLLYAHEKGVVHRDIKPGNIMLLHPDSEVTEGTVKIVDFGIAKLTQSEDGEIQTLTKTGEIFGSPIYMSPEQCKGTAVDKRSDIYSLGCVIFECLAGTPPFMGDSAMATMMMRLSDDIPTLKEASLGREYPDAVECIVRKMLATNPADRYQDLSGVIHDLMAMQRPNRSIVVGAPVKETPKKKVSTNRKKALLVAAVALGGVLVTATFDRAYVYPYYFLPDLEDADAPLASPVDSTVNERNVKTAKNQLEGPPLLDIDPQSDTEHLVEAAKAKVAEITNDERTSLRESASTVIKQEISEVAEVRDKLASKEFVGVGRRLGVRSTMGVPTIEVKTSPQGERREYLVFPDDYGSIQIGREKHPASGEILLPKDRRIQTFELNKSAVLNPNTFRNLTGLEFRRIEFPEHISVTNSTIAILKEMPNLEEVGLECSGITNLSPFYKSTALTKLDVAGTLISTKEILKVNRLMKLKALTFGPVPDAEVIFNKLADSTRIASINYRGALGTSDKGKGLEPNQVDALSKITHLRRLIIQVCPKFDDASLKKMLALKELQEIKITDCALTPACVSTLLQFKSLNTVRLPLKDWPENAVAALMRRYKVEETRSRKERNEDMSDMVKDTSLRLVP